ncbi:MAG: hypothetical protein JJP05_04360 [cyanobacterium endosymbiont of Rhopalodia gibba]
MDKRLKNLMKMLKVPRVKTLMVQYVWTQSNIKYNQKSRYISLKIIAFDNYFYRPLNNDW